MKKKTTYVKPKIHSMLDTINSFCSNGSNASSDTGDLCHDGGAVAGAANDHCVAGGANVETPCGTGSNPGAGHCNFGSNASGWSSCSVGDVVGTTCGVGNSPA